MPDSGVKEYVEPLNRVQEVENLRGQYVSQRLDDVSSSLAQADEPHVFIRRLCDSLYDASSKPHILLCAAQGEAMARFSAGRLRDMKFESNTDLAVAEDVVDVMGFEADLDRFIGNFLIADLMSYKEFYEDGNVEVIASLQDFGNHATRGVYPEVSKKLKELMIDAKKLGLELRRRVSALTVDPSESDYVQSVKQFMGLDDNNLLVILEETCLANDSGNVALVDKNMRKIMDHFTEGDYLIWDLKTSEWKKRLEDN